MIASAAITAMQMMVRRPMRLIRRAFSFLNRYFGLAFAERFPVEISVRTSFASLNSRRRAMFWRIAIPFLSSSSRIAGRFGAVRRSLFILAVSREDASENLFIPCSCLERCTCLAAIGQRDRIIETGGPGHHQ